MRKPRDVMPEACGEGRVDFNHVRHRLDLPTGDKPIKSPRAIAPAAPSAAKDALRRGAWTEAREHLLKSIAARETAEALEDLQPNHVYGESLHVRGQNIRLIEKALGEQVRVTSGFDRGIARAFHEELRKSGIRGTWWYEH